MHGSQSVCCLEEEAGTFVVAEIDTQCGYKIWYSEGVILWVYLVGGTAKV